MCCKPNEGQIAAALSSDRTVLFYRGLSKWFTI